MAICKFFWSNFSAWLGPLWQPGSPKWSEWWNGSLLLLSFLFSILKTHVWQGQQIGLWTRDLGVNFFCACATIVQPQWLCDSVAKSLKNYQKIINCTTAGKARIFSGVKKAEWHLSLLAFLSKFHKENENEEEEDLGVANWLPGQIPQVLTIYGLVDPCIS